MNSHPSPCWIILLCLMLMPCATQALDVQEVKMRSGATAWLVEDYHVPVIHLAVAFRDAGTTSDPAGKEGRASMLAQLLTEGTLQKDTQQFHRALENQAIDISAGVHADMLFVSMQTLAENRDTAFSLLAETILEPRLDPAKIQEVKSRMSARVRAMESSPEYLAALQFDALAYPDHPYGRPGSGTLASISAITQSDLQTLHQRYLCRDTMMIAAVGAISEQELQSLMNVYFSALPPECSPEQEIARATIAATSQSSSINRDLPQNVVMFGFEGLDRSHEDFYPAYVMNHILGGSSLSSRLGKVVRKENGLTYDISTTLVPQRYGAAWQGMFATRAGNAQQALTLTRAVMTDMAENGVSQAEVDQAIGYITGSFPLNIDRNSSIANYLITMQLHHLGMDYLSRRNELFRAVTREQVNHVASKFLKGDNLIVVNVGPITAPKASPEPMPTSSPHTQDAPQADKETPLP